VGESVTGPNVTVTLLHRYWVTLTRSVYKIFHNPKNTPETSCSQSNRQGYPTSSHSISKPYPLRHHNPYLVIRCLDPRYVVLSVCLIVSTVRIRNHSLIRRLTHSLMPIAHCRRSARVGCGSGVARGLPCQRGAWRIVRARGLFCMAWRGADYIPTRLASWQSMRVNPGPSHRLACDSTHRIRAYSRDSTDYSWACLPLISAYSEKRRRP
jgi:hypothetical protein